MDDDDAFSSLNISLGLWSANDSYWLEILKWLWKQNHIRRVHLSSMPMIPLKIHQIWLGTKALPANCVEWMKKWQEMNPSFEYWLWKDSDIRKLSLVNEQAFTKSSNPAQKSDILRLEILLRYGGVYVDVDFECLAPIEELCYKYGFFIGFSNTGRLELNNGLIASCAGHPLTSFLIDKLADPWEEWGGNFVDIEYHALAAIKKTEWSKELGLNHEITRHFIETTGPGYVTRAIMIWLCEQLKEEGVSPNIVCDDSFRVGVFPKEYFYPIRNNLVNPLLDSYTNPKSYPEAFAVHHWMKTWEE